MKYTDDLINILKEKNLLVDADITNIAIETITFDSRQVTDNTLFFCKGATFKKEYALDAKQKGAVAYVSEIDLEIDLPKIIVNDIRLAMSYLAAYFYDYPDKKLKMIGITGSKGKSTTVAYLKGIFDYSLMKKSEDAKKPCGIISTIETYDGKVSSESKITTPEALDLWQHLANAVDSGLEYMVVEVSSQALKYHRVTGIDFDIVALLNLGQDHISPIEHPSYEDYINSKLRIFKMSKVGVFCSEMDEIDLVTKKITDENILPITYSVHNKNSCYFAHDLDYHDHKTHFQLTTKEDYLISAGINGSTISNPEPFSLSSIGAYNVENALCAIAIADFFKIQRLDSAAALTNIKSLGRDHLFTTKDNKIICHINYAHTGLSFEKSFEAVKELFPNYRIVAMFGTSGDKALNRIEDLSTVAAKHADFVYLVPDDPGKRPHFEIATEMAKYLIQADCPYLIFEDRETAIRTAFREAETSNINTLLFLAGKGADNTQKMANAVIDINSDIDVASNLVSAYNQKISN